MVMEIKTFYDDLDDREIDERIEDLNYAIECANTAYENTVTETGQTELLSKAYKGLVRSLENEISYLSFIKGIKGDGQEDGISTDEE